MNVESAIQGETIGIIVPPPDIKAIVNKTAQFVARNGKSFEERILASDEGKSSKFNFLKYKSLNKIKAAQKNAFLKTLKTKGIQFREFKIKSITEEVLGELFSYFILETVAVGKMSNTDPFNQPAVEQVKHNTKKLLL